MTDTAALAALLADALIRSRWWDHAYPDDGSQMWDSWQLADDLAARLAEQGVRAPGDGLGVGAETWRCPGCRDTTAPEGMCQRCGVFGEMEPTHTCLAPHVHGSSCRCAVPRDPDEPETDGPLLDEDGLRAALAHTAADCASHTETVNPPQSASPVPLDRERLARWRDALVLANCPDPDRHPEDAEAHLAALDDIADAIADAYEEGRTDG